MLNLSTFLPCDRAGYFPTLTTYEWSVSSVGKGNKRTQINMSSKTLIRYLNTLTGNNKQPQCEDLWTELPIYQPVISTLLSLILSANNTF